MNLDLVCVHGTHVALTQCQACLNERVAELEERLEVYCTNDEGVKTYLGIGEYDGIGCRNETIKLLDEKVERLTSKLDRYRKALEFYANPESHELNGKWEEGYPGGITYEKDNYTFLDSGQIAQEALNDQ